LSLEGARMGQGEGDTLRLSGALGAPGLHRLRAKLG
jgi:hypothetical protein